MSKCDNCAIMAKMNECDEPCACAWYIDNVICGNKTIEECTAYKETNPNELITDKRI